MSVPSSALSSLASYSDSDDEEILPIINPTDNRSDTISLNRSFRSASINSPTGTSIKNDGSQTPRLVTYVNETILEEEVGLTKREEETVKDDCEEDDDLIPAEPSGTCPVEIQKKITNLYSRMNSNGFDIDAVIQQRKEFKNPSMYEKLIEFCGIDEIGTNYTPDLYDPHKWSQCLYYEELARLQNEKMHKLSKRTSASAKVDVVYGTAKRVKKTSKAEVVHGTAKQKNGVESAKKIVAGKSNLSKSVSKKK